MVAISYFLGPGCHISSSECYQQSADVEVPLWKTVSGYHAAMGAGGVRAGMASTGLSGGRWKKPIHVCQTGDRAVGMPRAVKRSLSRASIGEKSEQVSEGADREPSPRKEGPSKYSDGTSQIWERDRNHSVLNENLSPSNDLSTVPIRCSSEHGNEEDWGTLPRRIVSQEVVLQLADKLARKTERGKVDPESESETRSFSGLSSEGVANVRLLLELGASESSIVTCFDKYSRFEAKIIGPSLLASARALAEFGLGASTMFFLAENGGHSLQMFNENNPQRLLEIMGILRNRAKVKNMKKVLEAHPSIVGFLPQTLLERVRNVEELGVLGNGKVVENFPSILSFSPARLKTSMETLEGILGAKDVVRLVLSNPLLLNVRSEMLVERWATLRDLIGDEVVVRRMVMAFPTILVANNETRQETWQNMVENYGKDRALDVVQRCAKLLGSNWSTLKPKIDYLSEKGFDVDAIFLCPGILLFSLDMRIKPRFDALERRGGHEGLSLYSIVQPSNEAFEIKHGVELHV